MPRRLLDVWDLVQVLAWIMLLALLVWPLWSILAASVIDNETGALSLAHYVRVLTAPRFVQTLGNTLLAGLGGTTGAVLLGVTLAFLTTRFRIRGQALIQTLAVLALVSPPFIGAYAWIVLFGSNGVVRNALAAVGLPIPPIFGAWGVVIVFALKFFPHVYLIVSASLGRVNRSVEEAAESLGLPPWRRFLVVTLPLVMPAVSSAALLVFVLAIADFGTPKIIGRDFQVLATVAFDLFAGEVGGNPGMASALSVVLMVVSIAAVLLQRRAVSRDVYHSSLTKLPEPSLLAGARLWTAHFGAYAIALAGAIPVLVVVLFSFRKTRGPVFHPGFGLDSYRKVVLTLSDPIVNTIAYSVSATLLIIAAGTLIGYLVARRSSALTAALDAILNVPYIVPGIVVGIAFITRFNNPPLVLTGTGIIIVLAVFVRRLPYVSRSVAASLRQVSRNLEDAAVSLGYPPGLAFLKVTVPLIVPGILAGGLMSFVTAVNELSASLVLYVGGTITMPVRIFQAVSDGEYGTASALSSILVAMSGAAVYAAFRLSGRRAQSLV